VCDQTNDAILDTSYGTGGSEGIPEHSFDVTSSAFDPFPSDKSTDNSSSETDSKILFKEIPSYRLRNNECKKNEMFLCDWPGCNKSFEENRKRNNHIRTHTKPVFCSWSGCRFRDSCQKDMRRHFLAHRSQKTAQCRFCGKGFTRKYNLSRHEREKHGGKKRVRK
jgi:hypothetical protein